LKIPPTKNRALQYTRKLFAFLGMAKHEAVVRCMITIVTQSRQAFQCLKYNAYHYHQTTSRHVRYNRHLLLLRINMPTYSKTN